MNYDDFFINETGRYETLAVLLRQSFEKTKNGEREICYLGVSVRIKFISKDDVLVGADVTCYFPESNCNIYINKNFYVFSNTNKSEEKIENETKNLFLDVQDYIITNCREIDSIQEFGGALGGFWFKSKHNRLKGNRCMFR